MAHLDCLGRYDAIYLVRFPSLAFQPVARVGYVNGLKKLDVQYGRAPASESQAFRAAHGAGHLTPFVALGSLRVRDDYTCGGQSMYTGQCTR